jgi:excinuclease ABC subunit C
MESKISKQLKNLPQSPGVYFFKDDKGEIMYIGKATNLRSRVGSYFRNGDNRGEWIAMMVSQIETIDFQETESVLEALILESNLIKKHQPKYNTKEKDDKSFAYFLITKEEFPRVLIVRQTDLDRIPRSKAQISKKGKGQNDQVKNKFKYSDIIADKVFGPYTSKFQMQIALKIMRRIFPFHSLKQRSEKGCLDFQLGVCPGPYSGAISKSDYKKNIRGIRMILEGKKKRLVSTMEKEMQVDSKKHEFEKAAEIRNKIFALQHIHDVALMGREFERSMEDHKPFRVEAYDISNISGEHAVASMVVFNDNEPDKSQYRKFKIKTVEGSNDVAMMREVLVRRFRNDWPMPDLVILDGGQGHFNMGAELIAELGLALSLAAVAKGPTRKKQELRLQLRGKDLQSERFLANENLLKYIMDEAHRFAITFHRLRRKKGMIENAI